MDNHVRRFLDKSKPAFGYLQVLREKLIGQILGHIESGRWSVKRVLPTYLNKNYSSNEDEPMELPAAVIDADDKHTEHDQILQPQFTKDPSRFSLARDVPRDCVALLINETFLGNLQDIFNGYRDLGLLEGLLYLAKRELTQLERLLSHGLVNGVQ